MTMGEYYNVSQQRNVTKYNTNYNILINKQQQRVLVLVLLYY